MPEAAPDTVPPSEALRAAPVEVATPERTAIPGRVTTRLALALMALGATLRLWQYAANASLWADEANMALNIVQRPLARLLEPLDFRQVAPPGWLILEKAIVLMLGDGELALRLLPLLGSLVCLPLVWHVARRTLPPGVGPLLALALLALGIPFIHFAAQVKPYSTDVALALALLALAIELRRGGATRGRLAALWALGVGAPWVSYPAVFVLVGLGAVLLALAWRERDTQRFAPILAVVIAWAASAAAVLAWARDTVTPDDVQYMQRYWAHWFLPWPPRSLADLAWPIARLTTVYGGGGLRYPAPGVFLLLACLGTWALWRRTRSVTALLLAPIAVTFAAAAVRAYPFAPRVVLFLFPACLILTAAGAHALGALGGLRGRRLGWVAAAACVGLAAIGLARNPPPYAPEPLKPVLAAMRAAWQPGDRAYVYYGAEKAFVYYAPRFGFAGQDYLLGDCARGDLRAYLRELDGFRGTPRLWVVIAHAAPELQEDTAILGYLDRIGARRVSHRAGGAGDRGTDVARADLYDLSDPARLAADSADRAALPAASTGGRADAWSCHPGA